ncbi:MAG TPA: glycosyltransferase family 2 protein [Candidatus Omnitrophota bacterium]|nr:glycosyltransferase family 2 protein [Candidatus Omnitrophota bacterium]HRY85874.1 glycosyltransferase family 2 protein [Candidatus Omnitrophota bacterium]
MDRNPSQKIKLSVVIVNCDTAEMTLGCLRSVYQYKPACSFEVILVNNGSNGIAPEELEDFPQTRMIKTGKNLGFSKANNLGIYNSYGDFLVLLNSDTKLIDYSFDKMIAYMEQNEHVGALGPREVDGERRYRLSCGRFPTFFSELARKIWHYRLSVNDYSFRDYLDSKHAMVKDVDWVSGYCLMLRRSVLLETGLLDENFFLYFEDIDLCTRFWEKKWEVHYFPETSVIHYGGGSARRNLMLAMTEYRRSEIYFAKKYYGALGGIGIRIFLFLKYITYFLTWTPVLIFQKIIGKDTNRAYTIALLSKKVIQMVFTISHPEPVEPALNKNAANRSSP